MASHGLLVRTVAAAIAVGLFAAVVAAFVGRGSFQHFIIGLILAVYGAGGAMLAAVIAYLLYRKTGVASAKIATLAFGVLTIIAVLQLASLPLGGMLLTKDIEAAQAYYESLIPELEEFRSRAGRYPANFGELGAELPKAPRLVRDDGSYNSDGETYQFSLVNPGSIMGFYYYDSATGLWIEAD